MKNPVSDTPRTDAQLADVNACMETPHGNAVSASFARELERELNTWKAKCEKACADDADLESRLARLRSIEGDAA